MTEREHEIWKSMSTVSGRKTFWDGRRFTKEMRDTYIRMMILQGHSTAVICEKFGVSRMTVQRRRKTISGSKLHGRLHSRIPKG